MKSSYQQRFFPYAVLFILLGLLIEFSFDIPSLLKDWRAIDGDNSFKIDILLDQIMASVAGYVVALIVLSVGLLSFYRGYFSGRYHLLRFIIVCIALSALIRVAMYVLLMLLALLYYKISGFGMTVEGMILLGLPILAKTAGWGALKAIIHTSIMVLTIRRWDDWNVKKGIVPTFE